MIKINKKLNVGIFIFDNAEVLDFAGPFEVFSVCSELYNYELFDVFTVAKSLVPISAVNGLSVNPRHSFADAPPIDILIIAGGVGTRKQILEADTLHWIKEVHQSTLFTASICSGAMILGAVHLLDNHPYCTHKDVYEDMRLLVPTGLPAPEKRFVQTGKIFTSAGISAGIDLSFHILTLLHGQAIAQATAQYMEYDLK
ncbi:MAG TPA: AraC family transcriptional regulator [Microscillaceae bacterium]|jgi:transcriptional regulator GlxA family with amidase domain|nr:AraC family transcriptional regulator [Microscillaceae bacterium]